jgi:hypothetical protein
MPPQDQSADTPSISSLAGDTGPAAKSAGESGVRVIVPEKLDVRISIGEVPSSVTQILEKFAKPPSKSLVKDWAPIWVPIASGLISVVVSIFSYYYAQRENIKTEAANLATMVCETESGNNSQEEASHAQVIKVADYRDRAQDALKGLLIDEKPCHRKAGSLVAEQMYRAKTIDHRKLTKEILDYYESGDSWAQLGTLEWLTDMGSQLLPDDRQLALERLEQSFGGQGEQCGSHDPQVAQKAAYLLQVWKIDQSRGLALGLVRNCPATFEAAREQAAWALLVEVSTEHKESTARDLKSLLSAAPPPLADVIREVIDKLRDNKP